ncbi:MAG: hypothetical protein R2881_08690 [Eubacteriales bacterium]
MVLAGKVNKGLVNLIQNAGGRAVGLSGMDRAPDRGEDARREAGLRRRDRRHPSRTDHPDLLEKGLHPVVSTIGCDKQGKQHNINADTAAASIAGALRAGRERST